MFQLLILLVLIVIANARPGHLGLGLTYGGHGLSLSTIPHATVAQIGHVVAPARINYGVSHDYRAVLRTPIIGTIATPSVALASIPSASSTGHGLGLNGFGALGGYGLGNGYYGH